MSALGGLRSRVHPDALVDFRAPRLDLDSVYGRGNADQPYLYERHDPPRVNGDIARPLLGVERHPVSAAASRPDLPRNSEGLALIGDPRNDENTIVSNALAEADEIHNLIWHADGVLALRDPITAEQALGVWDRGHLTGARMLVHSL